MNTNNKINSARLLVLDVKNSGILSFDTKGNDLKTVTDKVGVPDGIAVDPINKHIYWTNMGVYHEGEHFPRNDGSIERINFDGSYHIIIIPMGATFTPKQLQLDLTNGFMYWSDREGMRVMRAKLDGSNITTLVQTGEGDIDRKDETRHCVGVAVDTENGYLYWTQKGPADRGEGRIFRANLDFLPGTDPANRSDVELLFDQLPEPIDLEIDHVNGFLYWTDRGNLPFGNSLNRASIDGNRIGEWEILNVGLKEGIGLTLDVQSNTVYFTDLGGNLYSCYLDGFNLRKLYTSNRAFTGIAYVPGDFN